MYYKWSRRYAASLWDRRSLADRSRGPHLDTEERSRLRRCRTFAKQVKRHRRLLQFYNPPAAWGTWGGFTPLVGAPAVRASAERDGGNVFAKFDKITEKHFTLTHV